MTNTPATPDSDATVPASNESGRHKVAGDASAFDDRLIDLVAADKEGTPVDAEELERRRDALGATFFSSIIAGLVGVQKPEREAEELWNELMKHKYLMSQRLGRNVGIRVAAMDFFSNITGDLASVRVIDSQTLLKTARLAITDGLTGLYNHRYFQDRLREEIDHASESDAPLSIVMLDIDYFKDYNDINGHVAGDVALHQVASTIRHVVGDEGVAVRYGGEEFGVILPQCGKRHGGEVSEAIRAAIEAQTFPNEFVLPGGKLTVSVGVAEFPLDGTDRRSLVDYADRAMYESKRQGKNRVCIMAPNRRREFRRHLALPALLCDGAGEAECFEARTINLSAGGLLLETDRMLLPHSAVRVRLPAEQIPGIEEEIVGVVVRSHQTSSQTWEAALRFVRLSDANRRALQQLLDGEDPAG